MSPRLLGRPHRRFRPGCFIERLEDRALLSVTAHDFSVNELENTPGAITMRPFVDDTATTPTLNFTVGTPANGGNISNFDAAKGTFVYTPPSATFLGTDTISFTATDTVTGETSSATATVKVGTIAASVVGVPVLKGTTKNVNLGPNVDDVVANPTLSFTIPATTTKGGTITNINIGKGTFTYTPPNATFTGTDTLSYSVKDTTTNATSTSTVVFNVATLIANADTADVLEGTSKIVNLTPDILDVTPNPALTFAIPVSSAKGGAITKIDTAKGIFTYTPPSPNFTGTDTLTYSVTDTATGTKTTGVLTLNVANLIAQPIHVGNLRGKANVIHLAPAILDVTANPTFTFSIPITTDQAGTISNIDAAKGVFTYTPPSATFTGIDSLTYTVTDTATNATAKGTVAIDVATLLADPINLNVLEGGTKPITLEPSIEDVTANPTLTFTIPATSDGGGAITNIDTVNGTFTYAPPSPTFTGSDTLTYKVTDTGTNATATGIVIVNVASIVAGAVKVSDLKGTAKPVELGPAVQDTTLNPTLKFTIPASSAQGGTISNIDTVHGTFTYTPPTANFTGTDTLTYTVTDLATTASDTGTVTISVATIIAGAVNVGDLKGQSKNIAVGPLVQDVTANPTLTFTIPATAGKGGTITNINTSRGTFTYTPPSPSFTGTETLTYTVTDTATKATDTGTVTIDVATLFTTPARLGDLVGKPRTVNLGPAVQDLTANPTLHFTIPGITASGGTITNVDAATGTFTYTPPSAGFTGTDSLNYTVTDTTTAAVANGSVTINVAGLFADAVGVGLPQNTSRNITLGPAVQDSNATPTLSFLIPASSDQGGAITNINAAKGTFTYTPPSPSFFGADTLTYKVTDTVTQATDSAQVTIDVRKALTTLTITSTSPANGSVVSVLPNGQIIITFSHPLNATTLYQAGATTTGLLTADPYSVFLIARGPTGAFSAPQPNNYQGGDLPIHANTSYKVNADGTSQITLTPTAPLAADVYAISVNGEYTDQNGDTLAAGIGQGTFYATFLFQPPPVNNNPLQVTGVTTYDGFTTINNNAIFQPDTIAIRFNKPLFAGAANSNTVQLLAKQGANVTVVSSVAAYSPTTDSIYLTPTAALNPGTTYLIRVAGQDSGAAHVSDDQGYGGPGFPLTTTFYDSFTVQNGPVGAGQGPLKVATTNGAPTTLPATDVIWTAPLGYASIKFTEPVALSSFGRYSAMLVPASGGLNPTGLDPADVPLNATLAFNPNTNQLIIIPSTPVGNDLYLYELSNIKAALANGQPNPADPLLDLSGQPAGTVGAPYFKTFQLTATSPAHAAVLVAGPATRNDVPAFTTEAIAKAATAKSAHPIAPASSAFRSRFVGSPLPSATSGRARRVGEL